MLRETRKPRTGHRRVDIGKGKGEGGSDILEPRDALCNRRVQLCVSVTGNGVQNREGSCRLDPPQRLIHGPDMPNDELQTMDYV